MVDALLMYCSFTSATKRAGWLASKYWPSMASRGVKKGSGFSG